MSVTIFCLGKKAYDALYSLDSNTISIIDEIVIGNDKQIACDYSLEIKKWATEHHLKNTPRKDFEKGKNKSIFLIAIGWRWIINPMKKQKLIVLHDSLLPKHRGFNPLVTALINGDEKIGVTALFGNEDFDKGDIISQEEIKIEYPIKIKDAIEKISNLYQTILSDLLNSICQGKTIRATAQNHEIATYSLWRDEQDYKINWNQSSHEIKRFIDAVGYPYKGAYTMLNETKVIITEVEEVEDVRIVNRDIGKVIFKKDKKPVIVCAKGLLKINEALSIDREKLSFENQFRIRFH